MSQFDIDIRCDVDVSTHLVEAAREAVAATLKHQNIQPPASVSLLLTDDESLRQLNNDFLGYDEPTDVLSFPSGTDTPGIDSYLGDIAVSVQRAQLQADSVGHTLKSELSLLIVHGVLHLLDYDHADEDEKQLMASVQTGILCSLGVNVADPFTTR